MHEHIAQQHIAVPPPTERSFGLVFAGVFAVLGLIPLWTHRSVRWWALALAAGWLLLALAAPRVLAPANRVWTAFGQLLHSVVSPVALGVLFYGVVTPTGFLMRRFGKRLMPYHFDPTVRSYWVPRTPPGPDADSLRRQF